MFLRPHDRLLVVGMTGNGKTYFVRREIVELSARVVVWAPHREYGIPTTTLRGLASAHGLLDAPRVRIAIEPDCTFGADLAAEFALFAQLMSTSGGITIVIEEVGMLDASEQNPSGKALKWLATQSRHFPLRAAIVGCPLVFVAQRAVMLPPGARSQCNRIISFRQTEARDLEAFTARTGSPDFAARVRRLKRWEHADWSEDA